MSGNFVGPMSEPNFQLRNGREPGSVCGFDGKSSQEKQGDPQ
jgi:hypothetical protein